MNFSRPSFLTQAFVWFGVVAAPLAWVGFHLVGVGVAGAACAPAGQRWGLQPNTWAVALTAACGVVAAGGITVAVLVVLRTRDVEKDAAPPLGRIHFLGIVGIVVGLLSLFVILMAGLGSTVTPRCVQS